MSRTMSSSASFSLKMRTALIGSPTYLSSENLLVLTSPPLRTSRQGMTLARSTSQLREVLQKSNTILVALFWVELNSVDVSRLYGAGKGAGVFRLCENVVRVVTIEVIGMQEIEQRCVPKAV